MHRTTRRLALAIVIASLWLTPRIGRAQDPSHGSASSDCRPDLDGVFARLLAARLGDTSKLSTGAGTDFLVESFVERACAQPEVSSWLPRTCAPWTGQGDGALLELRHRMIGDLASIGARAVEKNAGGEAGAVQLRLVQVAIVGVLQGASPEQLPGLLVPSLEGAQRCDELPSLPPVEGTVPPDLEKVARILQAVAAQPDDPVPAVASVLGDDLDPAARATLGQLLDAYALATATYRTLDDRDLEAWLTYSRSLISTLGLAYALSVEGPPITELTTTYQLVEALSRGEPERALAIGVTALEAASGVPTIDKKLQKTLERGVRIIKARNERELMAAVRGFLLPLPWSSRWVFDINAGYPVVARGNLRLAADALFGYNGAQWGLVAGGGFGVFNVDSAQVSRNVQRFSGDLDGWWSSSPTRPLRFEVGGSGTFEGYQFSVIDPTDTAQDVLLNENNYLIRGLAKFGVRYQPRTPFAALARVGAGGQLDIYNTLNVPSLETNETLSVGTTNETTGTFLLDVEGRLQFLIVPRYIVGRTRTNYDFSGLRRLSEDAVFAIGMNTASSDTIQLQLHELGQRLFIDAEVLRFLGFVPAIQAGFDLIAIRGDEMSNALVWEFGAGIRRVAF